MALHKRWLGGDLFTEPENRRRGRLLGGRLRTTWAWSSVKLLLTVDAPVPGSRRQVDA